MASAASAQNASGSLSERRNAASYSPVIGTPHLSAHSRRRADVCFCYNGNRVKPMIAPAKSPYDTDLDRNAANYVPLSPLGFIERSAAIYPRRTAVVHGARRYSWAESYTRCRRLASALARRG